MKRVPAWMLRKICGISYFEYVLEDLVYKRNSGFKVRILILSTKVGYLLRFNEVGEE